MAASKYDEIPKPKKYDKVIFLDFDGVISLYGVPGMEINKDCVNNLYDICYAHIDAVIVISSSWRYYYDLKIIGDFLQVSGFPDPPIVSMTPADVYSRSRAGEIAAWIGDEKYEGNYVIIDDEPDEDGIFKDHWFRTDPRKGLTREIASDIIEYFNKPTGK